jgi:hypothetical protein
LKSQKATPVMTAFAQTRTDARAFFICRRLAGVAFALHIGEAASAIM